MRRTIIIMMLVAAVALLAGAQESGVRVNGKVIDRETESPLKGASVLIKGSDGKIRKYARTGAAGEFSMEIPSTRGCHIEVTMMGYEKRTLPIDSVTFPIDVYIDHGVTELKEVAVTADRIREQGDTITYRVGAFAQPQDRSIGDVLARMPGIDVKESGKIEYQGKGINKFYIEGADLLGGKYGIATNGINHEDVGAVEVMENHQPLQVLAGLSYSQDAAINLKLKEKAKAKWIVNGRLGAGYSGQPEGALMNGSVYAMAVMPTFQVIMSGYANNTGHDVTTQATDFLASSRLTGLSRYVGVSLPGVPYLREERTLFNRSALVTVNGLRKLRKGELKGQIDYTYNRIAADASSATTYFLEEGNRVVAENRSGVDRSHGLSAKLTYEMNTRSAFVGNTLKGRVGWDDARLTVDGSLSNTQRASLPDYHVDNSLRVIKRYNDRHLVTFNSRNEWESLPQTLAVTTTGEKARTISQNVRDHAFFTSENVAYSFTVSGLTIGMTGGIEGRFRSLRSSLPDLPEEIAGEGTNAVSTNSIAAYVSPKLEYKLKRMLFTLRSPLNFTHYSFDKAIPDRREVYFSPSLNVNWKPNKKLTFDVNGSSGRSPMSMNLIHPGLIMTGYRYFTRGVDDFYTSTSQSVSAGVAYKHARAGLFGNANVTKSWNHLPYTSAQQLFGDYVVYSYTPAKSDDSYFRANGRIGKTIGKIRGGANIHGGFSKSHSNVLSEGKRVNTAAYQWFAGGKINGTPIRYLGFEASFTLSSNRLGMDGESAPWLSDMEWRLMFNLIPDKRWECRLGGEYYRNEISDDTYKDILMLDAKVIFKPIKRLELTASLTNLLDHRTYSYTTYGTLSSFESIRRLRGRELLISLTIR